MIDETTMCAPCRCECGCSEPATGTEESVPVCEECAVYTVDRESGDCVCSRQMDADSPQCDLCGEVVTWGGILTGSPGESNRQEGSCECREWVWEQRGGWALSGVRWTSIGGDPR